MLGPPGTPRPDLHGHHRAALDGQRVRHFFDRALTEAQVRRRKLYALWHTVATLILLRRESPKLVAARLGHANETLVIQGQDLDTADRLA